MKYCKKFKAYFVKNQYEEIRNGYGLYLRRWKLFPRNKVFNIYLHQIILSDERVYHDHRYASLSFVLKGQMIESIHPDRVRLVKPWRAYFRSPTMMHFLTLFGENPVWTLFIAGPEVKRWGFMGKHGWVEHKEFLKMSYCMEINNEKREGRNNKKPLTSTIKELIPVDILRKIEGIFGDKS